MSYSETSPSNIHTHIHVNLVDHEMEEIGRALTTSKSFLSMGKKVHPRPASSLIASIGALPQVIAVHG